MSEPITLMTLAALAAVGTGVSAYAEQKSADAQKDISAGTLQLGKDRLSQEDKHFRQNRELQQQQVAENRPGKAMGILSGLGQLKRQQF